MESLRFDFESSICYLGLFNCTSNNFSGFPYVLENCFEDFNVNKCKVSSTVPDTQLGIQRIFITSLIISSIQFPFFF